MVLRRIPYLFILLLVACSEDDAVQEAPASDFSGFVVPSHFPQPVYDWEQNKPTEAGFELGRKLFYDTRLSRGNQVSCGSCHSQVHGFADHGVAISAGVDGNLGLRNSPAILNLAWFPNFMWDGGINHIEVMPVAPITDPAEMDMVFTDLENILAADSLYRQMFSKAFGSDQITSQKILLALTQFQGLIISADTKYDRYILGKENFSEIEIQGLEIFNTHCNDCHTAPLFTDFSFRNNGLEPEYTDRGRGRITNNPEDEATFKVPSLRNVVLTYPYMHDGSIHSLNQVLDHYESGIQPHPNLDTLLYQPIVLSLEDREALIAFLGTLTDYTLLADRQFSETP